MNKDTQPPEESEHPPEGTPPTSKPTSAPPEQSDTAQHLETIDREMSAFERSTLRWTRATFGIVIEVARNEQRAWVSIIGEKLTKEPVAGEGLSISYNIFNTGKTPALKMELREGIFVGFFKGPGGEPQIPDWRTIPTEKGAILFPGTVSGVLKETLDASKMTVPVVNAYNAPGSRSAIYLRLRIDYEDAFGRPHWVETCIKHSHGDALDYFGQCTTGIGIDPDPGTQRARQDESQQPNRDKTVLSTPIPGDGQNGTHGLGLRAAADAISTPATAPR